MSHILGGESDLHAQFICRIGGTGCAEGEEVFIGKITFSNWSMSLLQSNPSSAADCTPENQNFNQKGNTPIDYGASTVVTTMLAARDHANFRFDMRVRKRGRKERFS